MDLRSLLRTWFACALCCLPLLALLLVPQLMRSRAGSVQALMLGVGLLLVLLIAAFVLAPVFSALGAPVAGRWQPRTARAAAAVVWMRRTGGAIVALLTAVAVYTAGQALGYGLAEVVPYIGDNPAHVTDPTASPWIIHYPAYALQAVVIYVLTTLAVAVYAWRIRALHLRGHAAEHDAMPGVGVGSV